MSDEKTIMLMAWQDKKKVCMMSTFHDEEFSEVRDREAGTRDATKLKPKVCIEYRNIMKGVDLNDQIRASYDPNRKRVKKYYRKMYITCLDMSILNSFIIYNKVGKKKLTFLEYKIILIKQLVQQNNSEYILTRDGPRKPLQSSDFRLKPGNHHPKYIGPNKNGRNKQRFCKFCKDQTVKSLRNMHLTDKKRTEYECTSSFASRHSKNVPFFGHKSCLYFSSN